MRQRSVMNEGRMRPDLFLFEEEGVERLGRCEYQSRDDRCLVLFKACVSVDVLHRLGSDVFKRAIPFNHRLCQRLVIRAEEDDLVIVSARVPMFAGDF